MTEPMSDQRLEDWPCHTRELLSEVDRLTDVTARLDAEMAEWHETVLKQQKVIAAARELVASIEDVDGEPFSFAPKPLAKLRSALASIASPVEKKNG